MRPKKALTIHSFDAIVLREAENHFQGIGVERRTLELLVEMGVRHGSLAEECKMDRLDPHRYANILAFGRFFAQKPDTAIEVLRFVRNCVAHRETNKETQAVYIRDFLLRHPFLAVTDGIMKDGKFVSGKGALALFDVITEDDEGFPVVSDNGSVPRPKEVRSHELADIVTASFLNQRKFPTEGRRQKFSVASVKKARRMLQVPKGTEKR